MGYLWENMEKMSIQEERRNTAQARAEAEKAKMELEKALEDKISLVVEYCKRFQISKAQTIQELMAKCDIDQETARQKVDLYWNI